VKHIEGTGLNLRSVVKQTAEQEEIVGGEINHTERVKRVIRGKENR
jgi:hypothetical protein